MSILPLLFFNISGGEIFIILAVIFLIFGPKKIPELARFLGKGVYELKKTSNDIKKEINDVTNNIDNFSETNNSSINTNKQNSERISK